VIRHLFSLLRSKCGGNRPFLLFCLGLFFSCFLHWAVGQKRRGRERGPMTTREIPPVCYKLISGSRHVERHCGGLPCRLPCGPFPLQAWRPSTSTCSEPLSRAVHSCRCAPVSKEGQVCLGLVQRKSICASGKASEKACLPDILQYYGGQPIGELTYVGGQLTVLDTTSVHFIPPTTRR
jgi:hypothetical protein